MGNKYNGEAKLTIARAGSSNFLRMSVLDKTSGTEVLELLISHEDLARALTGQGRVGCEATWNTERLGLRKESKTEGGVTKDNIKSFEVDGWKARIGDLGNIHRLNRNSKEVSYSVVFFRWVKD